MDSDVEDLVGSDMEGASDDSDATQLTKSGSQATGRGRSSAKG